MKRKLEDLTIGRFIDLLCGDTEAILESEEATELEIALAIRDIVYQYREIADEAGVKSYLARAEEYCKARIATMIFAICDNLIHLNEHKAVREVLIEYGINARSMSDQRLEAEVKSNIEKTKRLLADLENGNQETGDTDIRREFDSQTASLMTYFKFQIDTETMKATIYAHLVARYSREVKARNAAMKK